jgi:hypothetical protein
MRSDPASATLSAARLDRRGGALLLAVGLVYAALVGTHRGEFWPFSVYPMFSRAGRPWTRAWVVRWPAALDTASLSGKKRLESWPGAPFPLDAHGLSQNDLSSLVRRAERWTADDRRALEHAFGSLPCDGPLVLMRVEGRLGAGSVLRDATPVAWLGCDRGGTRLVPLLARAAEPVGDSTP